MTIKQQIETLLHELGKGLYEKEGTLALTLLSAIAGESIFLLGPPGVAKSMIARRLKEAFRNGTAFEYLMSRFSTPDEIFGPVSIAKLKNEDKYERVINGYLPSATVVFLDEIWKAGPSIQNSLLTVINEKIFKNGNQTVHIPLQALIAASNELPAKNEGLEALWDRFIMRCLIGGIKSTSSFRAMIADTQADEPHVSPEHQLDTETLLAWNTKIHQITIPEAIFDYIDFLRNRINEYNSQDWKDKQPTPIYVSDRRWKKIIHLLRTSAFLNGSKEVRLADLSLLIHCLWDDSAQIAEVYKLVQDAMEFALGSLCHSNDMVKLLQQTKDELQSNHQQREVGNDCLRVINSFYYQVDGIRNRDRILIFTSEYQELESDKPQLFILVKDRMPNTKILKRYDKIRYPNARPSELYKIKCGLYSLFVGDKEFPLLLKEGLNAGNLADCLAESKQAPSFSANECLQNLEHKMQKCIEAFKPLKESENNYINAHLFVDDNQLTLLRRVMNRVDDCMFRLQYEINEIRHSNETENRSY